MNITGKINFNTKHLRKGDPLPAYDGKLRLYNMRFCPFAQRAVLVLNAKKIDYDLININLADKPEWYTKKSLFGTVPCLEVKEDNCIFESLVVAEYLDEAYSQRPLLSKDLVRRAMNKIIIQTNASIIGYFYKVVKSSEPLTEDAIKEYNKALAFIQEQLKCRGTTFLDGNEPGFTDYMIWPWFERQHAYASVEERLQLDSIKYKLLVEYVKNMLKDPVVAEYLVPQNVMIEFIRSYKNGPPNYDMLGQ